MSFTGTSKGYAYTERPIINVVQSLDGEVLRPTNMNNGILYKPIKENWYLSYDW
jgi:hypothetical protein